jgi:N,N'-diacetyllegionaminate synthase
MKIPFIIAEIAQAHDGSLGMLHSYIDALSKTGVNAVKFQTHIAAAESSEFEPFRVKFSYVDKTRFDYWRRMEFTKEHWKEIKAHCDSLNIEFISSPFSNAAVDLLEEVGVARYKVGSGEVSNFLLLEKIARTKKPVILSSGMSNFQEIDRAIAFFQERDNDVALLQCTTAYPTAPEQWGLSAIPILKSRYQIPVGYSDHSSTITACLAATALGAEILEFHAVFDRRMFGPDSKASLEIDEIAKLVEGATMIATSLNAAYDKSDNSQFAGLKNIFEKSLSVNRAMKCGEIIQFEDLEAKKPKGYGIDASDFKTVIGRVLCREKNKYDFLNEIDLEA